MTEITFDFDNSKTEIEEEEIIKKKFKIVFGYKWVHWFWKYEDQKKYIIDNKSKWWDNFNHIFVVTKDLVKIVLIQKNKFSIPLWEFLHDSPNFCDIDNDYYVSIIFEGGHQWEFQKFKHLDIMIDKSGLLFHKNLPRRTIHHYPYLPNVIFYLDKPLTIL